MLFVAKQFYDIFTPRERRGALLLFFPTVISALMNVIGIAFVVPFIAIINNPRVIQTNQKIALVYHKLHFTSAHHFLLLLGIVVLATLIIGNSISAVSAWLTLRFTNLRSFTFSKRLLEKYLQQPYAYFLNKNSAVLTKNILSEVDLVVSHVLQYGFEALTKSVAMFLIAVLLFVVNPLMALVISVVLGGAYVFIYAIVRKRLARVSNAHVEASEQRYRITQEAFGGIKEIKLQHCEHIFLNSFDKPARQFASHEASAQIIANFPRYLLEVLAFGGILIIALCLLALHQHSDHIMPLLALYAMAGYRLLPGLQSIFGALTSVRAYASALSILHRDLTEKSKHAMIKTDTTPVIFSNTLSLKNIYFHYPQSNQIILNHLNLSIAAGESIGVVGETGAGKTTLVDILLGLLTPTAGVIEVDGIAITPEKNRAWQQNLGYVPQHIYLADDTIASNIAFGVDVKNIDMTRVTMAAKMAAIHTFIETELPDGYETTIGERGIRLSGGQRQRLGIARALYRDPAILIFDEATSALDSVTETQIMQAIYGLSRKKTLIIIAHRISTLMDCNKIIVLEKGTVQAIGTYHTLAIQNESFQRLAKITT